MDIIINLLKFQFLIGTVKTTSLFNYLRYFKMFQFLIGTVKTIINGQVIDTPARFQFLIGTVKTRGF